VLADEHATLWTRFRALCARVSRAQGFELFNACTIMVNAIVLGLNWCVSWRLYLLLTLNAQALDGQVSTCATHAPSWSMRLCWVLTGARLGDCTFSSHCMYKLQVDKAFSTCFWLQSLPGSLYSTH